MKYLSYCWRLCSTAFCFTLFGLGGLLISIFVCPLQRLMYRDQMVRNQKTRQMVHYLFKFFVQVLNITGTIRFNIENKQELNNLRGHIVMANHPSLIDVVVLISIIPNADCVVKASLFKNPFMKAILNNTGYISNDSADGVIDDCNQSLAAGNNLIIFPEGTRTTAGKTIKFQRGAANIALRCRAAITTVVINVTPTTLTKAEKWYHIPQRRALFTLRISNSTPNFEMAEGQAMSKMSRQFTAVLEQHFIQELKKA